MAELTNDSKRNALFTTDLGYVIKPVDWNGAHLNAAKIAEFGVLRSGCAQDIARLLNADKEGRLIEIPKHLSQHFTANNTSESVQSYLSYAVSLMKYGVHNITPEALESAQAVNEMLNLAYIKGRQDEINRRNEMEGEE